MEISVLLSFTSVPHRVQDAEVLFLELTDNFLLQILLLLSTIFPGSFNLPQGWTWKAQLDLILLLLLIASVAIEHLNPNPARKGFLQSYFKIISLGSPKSCLSLYLLSVCFWNFLSCGTWDQFLKIWFRGYLNCSSDVPSKSILLSSKCIDVLSWSLGASISISWDCSHWSHLEASFTGLFILESRIQDRESPTEVT